MTTIYETPAGSALKFKIEFNSTADKALYFQADWNRIERAGLQGCGDYWITDYLPLRFTPYARAMGLYTGQKKSGPPLVNTGYLKELVLASSRAEAVVTSSRARVDLVIPLPNTAQGGAQLSKYEYFNYASNPVVNDSLSAITTQELERMGEVAAEIMTDLVNGSTSKIVKTNVNGIAGTREVLSLTSKQRDTLTAQRKAIKHPSLRRPRPLIATGKAA